MNGRKIGIFDQNHGLTPLEKPFKNRYFNSLGKLFSKEPNTSKTIQFNHSFDHSKIDNFLV